jgi:GDPmannose 4,6-dehydratase
MDPELITVHSGDLTDRPAMTALLDEIRPSQIYNLGGLSSVEFCWTEPVLAAEINGTAAVFLMEAAWKLQEKTGEQAAFVQASSAEIFGEGDTAPQDESTPIRPVNPYGASKALAHLSVGVYRARGLHASSLILYNHESPLRPPSFVTGKITQGAAAIAKGEATELRLGNLEACRDWGWAPDYVAAMALAATHPEPGDYVIGTGEAYFSQSATSAAAKAAATKSRTLRVVRGPCGPDGGDRPREHDAKLRDRVRRCPLGSLVERSSSDHRLRAELRGRLPVAGPRTCRARTVRRRRRSRP